MVEKNEKNRQEAYEDWLASLGLEESHWDRRSDAVEEQAKYYAYEAYLDNGCMFDSYGSWAYRLTGQQLMALAVEYAESEWQGYI